MLKNLIEADVLIAADVVEHDEPAWPGLAGDIVSGSAEHGAILSGMLTSTIVTVVLVLAGLYLFFRTLVGLGAWLVASVPFAFLAGYLLSRRPTSHVRFVFLAGPASIRLWGRARSRTLTRSG